MYDVISVWPSAPASLVPCAAGTQNTHVELELGTCGELGYF